MKMTERRSFRLSSRINDAFDVALGAVSEVKMVALIDPYGIVGPVEVQESEYSIVSYPGDDAEKLLMLRLDESYVDRLVKVTGVWGD